MSEQACANALLRIFVARMAGDRPGPARLPAPKRSAGTGIPLAESVTAT